MQTRSGQLTRSLLALIAASLAAPLTAQADPPPWAPAHGYRAKQARPYHYVYYPAQQVYFSPEQHMWFWMSGSNWQFGVNLPARYQVVQTSGIAVTLASERPYREHVYVEEHYGRPWRDKHGPHDRHREKHEERHKEGHKEKHHKHHGHD